jgi:hypothetical protein
MREPATVNTGKYALTGSSKVCECGELYWPRTTQKHCDKCRRAEREVVEKAARAAERQRLQAEAAATKAAEKVQRDQERARVARSRKFARLSKLGVEANRKKRMAAARARREAKQAAA